MESKSDLNAQFANAFYRKLVNQSSPSWLAKLKMLEGKKGKITFGGIPHKAYWFDLKRNHFSIIVDVLNEVCPHLGPFNKKTIIFQENEDSGESIPLQSENPSETFKDFHSKHSSNYFHFTWFGLFNYPRFHSCEKIYVCSSYCGRRINRPFKCHEKK